MRARLGMNVDFEGWGGQVIWETRAAWKNASVGDKDGYPSCWRKLPHHPLGRFNGHPLRYVSSPQDKRGTSITPEDVNIPHTNYTRIGLHVGFHQVNGHFKMSIIYCDIISVPLLFCVYVVHFVMCVAPYASLIGATAPSPTLLILCCLWSTMITEFICDTWWKKRQKDNDKNI